MTTQPFANPPTWYRVAFHLHSDPETSLDLPQVEFIQAEAKARSPEMAGLALIAKAFPKFAVSDLEIFQAELMPNGSYRIPFPHSKTGVWVRPIREGDLS